jgi:peptidyl-prolyl cis-trans isomerase B (cyclophilin B)
MVPASVSVKNWRGLAKQGFYDGTPFARVIKDFVIQGGALDGSGDEATSIFGEIHTV